MKIELKKISNTHHLLRCTRDDGTVEEATLETKSLLVHDLTHLAYERERGLQKSFWGLVAGGVTFQALRGAMEPDKPTDFTELAETEGFVGPLQGVMLGRVTARDFVLGFSQHLAVQNEKTPEWMTMDFVLRVQARFNAFYGEWKALPFARVMTIDW